MQLREKIKTDEKMINYNKYKKQGWFNDSHRHYLAAKGIKSKHEFFLRKKPGVQTYLYNIPILAKPVVKGNKYPITPSKVKRILGRMPKEDLVGLKSVEFTNPSGEQKGAWAQYVRSRKALLIFSQPYEDSLFDGQSPQWVNTHIKEYVLPHEIGHHKALYQAKITDKSLKLAEARADANVVGMDPTDRDVVKLKM